MQKKSQKYTSRPAQSTAQTTRQRAAFIRTALLVLFLVSTGLFHSVAQATFSMPVYLKAQSGYFISAQNGGGAGVTVDHDQPSTWETFILSDISGGNSLQDGHQIVIQSHDGSFLSTLCGGGGSGAFGNCGSIQANRKMTSSWETFSVYKLGGSAGSGIVHGDLIAIRSYGGQYCSADTNGGGPGSSFTCTREARGGWEVFTFLQPGQNVRPRVYSVRAQSGYLLSAAGGGGSQITVDRYYAGGWETFTIANQTNSSLSNGDQVTIRSATNQLLSIRCGGAGGDPSVCGTVTADRSAAGSWEMFTLVKLGGSGGNLIQDGDPLALRTSNGSYCSADVNGGGAGSVLSCNRPAPGGWEIFSLSLLGGGSLSVGGGATGPQIAGWDLVFDDEFDQTQLDTSKWWTRYINGGPAGGRLDGTTNFLNDGQERYGEFHNHIMTGDSLRLTAYGTPDSWEHSSGMVRSKKTFKYGYFEARLKVPAAAGTFPAFWMVPDSTPEGTYSGSPPELDFMEHVQNANYPGNAYEVHMGYIKDVPNTETPISYLNPNFLGANTGSSYLMIPSPMADDYHTIGALWDTDDTLTFWLDGQMIMKRAYYYKHSDGSEPAYAHILLNLAVGGTWAGRPDLDWNTSPQALEVDYIRVYQRRGRGQTGISFIGQSYCPADGGC